MAALLVEAKAAVDAAREAGDTDLAPAVLARYRRRYRAALAAGHAANPVPARVGRRGPIGRSKPANLLGRLDRYRHDVLRFAADFTVPFDNNLAERDIRMVKLQQKISGSWRTTDGAERFLVVRGNLSTARKQGVHVLTALRQVFDGDPWHPGHGPAWSASGP